PGGDRADERPPAAPAGAAQPEPAAVSAAPAAGEEG
ncbi:MAG: hypothetical protein JWL68_4500, partial [Actinomycetia bacterium]|nr:hypothetical protein [Actinomycetes bacterium]